MDVCVSTNDLGARGAELTLFFFFFCNSGRVKLLNSETLTFCVLYISK